MEMNGYAVRYSEKTTADYAAEGITLGYEQDYHGYAVFVHAGYTYYLSTHSDNPDFFDETLKNKLIYGATHDPKLYEKANTDLCILAIGSSMSYWCVCRAIIKNSW